MKPHRIRLRRPWQCKPTAGSVCWRRPFNRPTGLGPEHRVWIIIEGFSVAGTASLGDHALGRIVPGEAPSRFDVTGQLSPHNELVLELEMPPPAADAPKDQPPAEVALEIVAPR